MSDSIKRVQAYAGLGFRNLDFEAAFQAQSAKKRKRKRQSASKPVPPVCEFVPVPSPDPPFVERLYGDNKPLPPLVTLPIPKNSKAPTPLPTPPRNNNY
jgi:hypothetical protein